jgi:hypothetical protein
VVLLTAINGRFPISTTSTPSFFQTLEVKKPLELLNDANETQSIDVKELEKYAQERVGQLSGTQVDHADLKLLCVHARSCAVPGPLISPNLN